MMLRKASYLSRPGSRVRRLHLTSDDERPLASLLSEAHPSVRRRAMQGSCESEVSGPTIRRAFTRSRYEASYLREVYDLLMQLAECRRGAVDAGWACSIDSHATGPVEQEKANDRHNNEDVRNEGKPSDQASGSLCSCVV
jgi:hypothetical protein